MTRTHLPDVLSADRRSQRRFLMCHIWLWTDLLSPLGTALIKHPHRSVNSAAARLRRPFPARPITSCSSSTATSAPADSFFCVTMVSRIFPPLSQRLGSLIVVYCQLDYPGLVPHAHRTCYLCRRYAETSCEHTYIQPKLWHKIALGLFWIVCLRTPV